MNRSILTVLACLLFATAASAGEADPRAKAEEDFFNAYYQEHGRRDPAAARKAYTQFIWDHDEDEAAADLCLRAYLGLARVAARGQNDDAAALLDTAKEWFARIRGQIRSPVRVALEEEISTVTAFLHTARGGDEVAGQIAGFLPELSLPSDNPGAKRAEDALVAFGVRAIPQLVEAMRGSNPRLVAGATRVLLRIPGDEPTMVLARALDDMDVLFPVQIAEQLSGAGERQTVLFEKALSHPLPEVRVAGLRACGRWLDENGSQDSPLWDLVTDLAEDAQPSVRAAALGAINWQAGTVRRLQAARSAANQPDMQRTLLTTWGLDPKAIGPEQKDLVKDLLDSDDETVRTVVLRLCQSRGGEVFDLACSELLQSYRRTDNLLAAAVIDAGGRGWPWPVFGDLVDAAFRAYLEEPEPTWEWTFNRLVSPIRTFARVIPEDVGIKLISPLVTDLSNTPSTPRRQAALVVVIDLLERFSGGRDAADLLIPSYLSLSKDSDRATWLWTFGERLGAKGRGIATEALQSGSDDLRFQAVRILAQHLSPEEIVPTLRPLLDDVAPRVREVAFTALAGVLEGEDLADIATAALDDPDPSVRSAAVVPMIESGSVSRYGYLAGAIQRDPGIAPLAVGAVARRVSPDEARSFARDILALLSGGEVDAAAPLRAATWAAAGPVLSDEMILEALTSGEPEMLRVAAALAGERRLLEAWPLLLSLNWDLPEAKAALETIRKFHLGMKEFRDVRGAAAEEAFAKARRLATSGDPVKRRAAALALAGLGSPEAISLLLDLVEDEDEPVRTAAVLALEKLGG